VVRGFVTRHKGQETPQGSVHASPRAEERHIALPSLCAHLLGSSAVIAINVHAGEGEEQRVVPAARRSTRLGGQKSVRVADGLERAGVRWRVGAQCRLNACEFG
jgi:hypothetical protein